MLYKREDDLVSVIITNYNNEKYIEDCLDSILNQSYKNIEIILVDDNSIDNSLEVINTWIDNNKSSFLRKDYITIINLPRNFGFSGAVTVGLFGCKGEFIAFHDGDDISNENRIEKQVQFLRNNTNINTVGSNYAVFSNKDYTPVAKLNAIDFGVDKIKSIYSEGGNCVCYGTLLIRGEIFDKIGGLSRKLKLVEDYEYITKLLDFGIDNINEYLYYYRSHEKQRSHGLYENNTDSTPSDELNVLLVIDRFNIGGTETHVLSLAEELINKGINVVVMANEGPLCVEFEKLNCKIYNVDFPLYIVTDSREKYRYENEIKKIIKEEKINLVHGHQSPSGALCIDICNKMGVACVFTIHGLYYQDIVKDRLKLVDNVISVSKPVSDWLTDFEVNSRVIPNAVDFDKFKNLKNKNNIREELDISEDAFVVLYCSRLAWHKSAVAQNLIKVCRDLKRMENIDIHVLIIGDGPGFNNVNALAENANKILKDEYVHVLGGKTDLKDYYSTCDCVVGTGRVAIEAMAFEKTIIASGNHGYFGILSEDNLEDSWDVYFGDHKSFKVNSSSHLYNDLKYIYYNKNKSETISTICNMWAKNKFDIKFVIEDIIKIYKHAIYKNV